MTASRVRRILPVAAIVAAFIAAIAIAGCSREEGTAMTPPPPEVTVATVERGRLPLDLEYTGRAAGSREVEVRALVSGILLERRYEEGRPVQAGDVLFLIDPDRYRAAESEARAEVGVERARLAEAIRQRDRLMKLVDQNLVSQSQLDAAVSAFEVAQANLAAAEARLRTAQLDLSYTEVRAPISGLTSREARSEGSLVTAGDASSLVTRIVQTDPIYIEFSGSRPGQGARRGRLVGRQRAGRAGRRARPRVHGAPDLRRQRRGPGFRHRPLACRDAEPRCSTRSRAVRARACRGHRDRGRGVVAAPRRDDERPGQFRVGRVRRRHR